jgi:hypothetical protein
MALTLDGDNGVSGVNGSAGTPALQGTDTNTGISFGTDTVNLVTGGSNRATVDSSGRLLVGTSTSTNVAGFGETKIQSRGNYESSITVVNTENNANTSGLIFAKVRSTSIVQNGDPLGGIYYQGYDGSAHKIGANILAYVDGAPGANVMPGRLVFSTTAGGASSPTERMRITSDGTLKVKTTSATPAGCSIFTRSNSSVFGIVDQPTTSVGYPMGFYNSSGTGVGYIETTASSTSYVTSSDYRLKENVVPLTGAADRINQLQVHRFNFIVDPDTTVDGFLAHEAQIVVPEAVTGTHNGVEVWKEGEELPDGVSVGDNKLNEDGNTIPVYQGIDQSKLVPLLTAALQEALAKIETLETRLTALEGGAS